MPIFDYSEFMQLSLGVEENDVLRSCYNVKLMDRVKKDTG